MKNQPSPKAKAPRHDVFPDAKQASLAVLLGCLVDLEDLYNATRQAHWNVRGPQFASLHSLFEECYNTLRANSDDLAERVVQLGGTAYGTTQVLANQTRLPPYPTDLHDGMDHVGALAIRYAQVAAALCRSITEVGDAGTSDLLTEQSRTLDKMLWMLEAHFPDEAAAAS